MSDLTLKVLTREDMLFQGKVQVVSSTNDKGKFDVLGRHANFITLIKDKLTIRDVQGEVKEINLKNGVMRVFGGNVDVYLGLK